MEIVLIWLLFAIFSAALASFKNRSGVSWFFIGLLFGPFGLLVVFFPKIEKNQKNTNLNNIKEIETVGKQNFEDDWVTFGRRCQALRLRRIGKQNFEDDWVTLVKYDEDVKACVKKLEKYGEQAIEEFKKAYRVIGDRSKLPKIAEEIMKEIGESRDENIIMKKYGISFENEKYIYKGYKYDKLEDAVNYAKLKNK